jgi:hypothetical protein
MKKSFFAAIISVGFALLTGVIGGFGIHDLAADQSIRANLLIGSFVIDILIAVACFFIVKKNPSSFWYVPIICNAYSIIGVIGNHHLLWETSMGISFICGWVLSLIASILGALKGRKAAVSDNP